MIANQRAAGSTYDERYKFTGKEWDEFFKDNPSPTKEQVIEFRDHTEQKVWGNTGDSPLQ